MTSRFEASEAGSAIHPLERLKERRLAAWQKRLLAGISIGKSTECWPWLGPKLQGYGRFFCTEIGENASHTYRAHRLSYELFIGPVPSGLSVCHICDNPPCCNPNHLWLGTKRDNAWDMFDKERNPGFPPCPRELKARGERGGRAEFTEADVRAILCSADKHVVLARRYGVSPTAIRYIRMGRTWAHIDRTALPIPQLRFGAGSMQGHAKLTEGDVRRIREGGEPPAALAAALNIDLKHVYAIRNRTRWAHLP